MWKAKRQDWPHVNVKNEYWIFIFFRNLCPNIYHWKTSYNVTSILQKWNSHLKDPVFWFEYSQLLCYLSKTIIQVFNKLKMIQLLWSNQFPELTQTNIILCKNQLFFSYFSFFSAKAWKCIVESTSRFELQIQSRHIRGGNMRSWKKNRRLKFFFSFHVHKLSKTFFKKEHLKWILNVHTKDKLYHSLKHVLVDVSYFRTSICSKSH